MFYFLLELQVLLWVGHLFELFELLPELHIVIVQLLAFKTDLQSFQLLGSQFAVSALEERWLVRSSWDTLPPCTQTLGQTTANW